MKVNENQTVTLGAAEPQPPPKQGKHNVTAEVIFDLVHRSDFGYKKYGTRLLSHNGRDNLMDAYQEALDLCCYLKACLLEREEPSLTAHATVTTETPIRYELPSCEHNWHTLDTYDDSAGTHTVQRCSKCLCQITVNHPPRGY